MDISNLFDQQTLDAITADAKASGISEEEVRQVLGILTDETKAPTRSANSQGELMSLISDNEDDVVTDVAAAAGVERGKTNTILMLALPFLLKYLLGNNSSSQSNSSLLGSLLGMGNQSQTSSMGGLLNLLGSQTQQTQTPSLLGSLLGVGAQPQYQQPTYSTNSTASLLNALMGAQPQQIQAQQVQPLQQQNAGGDLFSLFGGSAQPQQQSNPSGSLLGALFNLLGDN